MAGDATGGLTTRAGTWLRFALCGLWLAIAAGEPGLGQGVTGNPEGRRPAESGVVEGWTFTLRDQGRLRARFAGARARPLPGNEFDVENLRVETYRADGELDVVAVAPFCRVRMTNESFVVSSPGELDLRQVDGRFSARGHGFVWDHATQKLVVTNRVATRVRVTLPGESGGAVR